ncbi:guanylate-binding protein 1-like [Pseudophryne corroboree]|uniref:guanylate-binding protein 1-like n=1 Tax=Pseudophryne corroboree TaxID=495146 RepID=UPI0030815AC2
MMAPIPKMAAPVCLIENPAGKKLSVNPEALKILERISQPLVVVSIIGPYRSGKSFLMNTLSGHRRGGFSLGHTVKANTKGIWMQSVPHPKQRGHTLILLDTEGLGDVEKGDKQNDRVIMSLALLMSSAVIYNSRDVINQDAVEKLHAVTELHQRIMQNAQEEEDVGQEDSEDGMAPHFVWVVRDFTLKSELGGRAVSADEYLEDCLKDIPSVKTLKAHSKNEMRATIRSHFPKRKCFLFELPSPDEEVLNRMDRVPDTQLQPGFLKETKNFCQFILEEVPAKPLRPGEPITGPTFAQLMQSYINVVTTGDITCLEQSKSQLSLEKNTKALQRSSELYNNRMRDQFVNTELEFRQLHEASVEGAVQEFKNLYVKHEKTLPAYEEQLKDDLVKLRDEIWKNCEDSSRMKCKAVIEKLKSGVDQCIKDRKYHVAEGHSKFIADKDRIVQKYNQEPDKGVKAEDVLQEYLKELEGVETIILQTDKALSANKPKLTKVTNPSDCAQLTQYIQGYQLPTGRFHRVLIQLFGFAGHGKSSFVNSCLYVGNHNNYQDQAGEATSYGGKTMDRRGYKLTESITIVDNRGFGKLDSPETWEIYAQLCNFVPLDEIVLWNKNLNERIEVLTKGDNEKSPDVIVPALVYSSEQSLNDQEYESIKEFLKNAQKLTGILPFIILSKSTSGAASRLQEKFTQMGMENIYPVENYLQSDPVALRGKHLNFLTFLKDVLDCVDFHLQQSARFQNQRQDWVRFLMNMAGNM